MSSKHWLMGLALFVVGAGGIGTGPLGGGELTSVTAVRGGQDGSAGFGARLAPCADSGGPSVLSPMTSSNDFFGPFPGRRSDRALFSSMISLNDFFMFVVCWFWRRRDGWQIRRPALSGASALDTPWLLRGGLHPAQHQRPDE